MALVLPFALLRPVHPRGNVSLLGSQLRAPGAVTSGSRLWLPSDLGTKLKLWLKGDDLTGTNGSNVASWADASGNSNNATPVTAHPTLVTAGQNGLNTVAFAGASAQYFTLPTGLLTGRTSSASFAVYSLTNSPPTGSGGGAVFGDFGTDASSNHDPYTDGNFYDDYCSTTRRTVSGVSASTAFRIFGLRSQANDWRLDINGTNQYTDATNTVGVNSAPLLGFTASAGIGLDGQIAEVVDCNDFLTTAEKEQVEGYLAWKWGLQASLPGGHTYASAAPTVGSGSPDVTLALTGQLATAAQGSTASSTTLALTGQTLSVAQGAVSVASSDVTAALTGQLLTAARGTLTPNTAEALSGQSLSAAQGTLSPSLTEALTGQALGVARGTLSPTNALALIGQATTLTRGSLTPAASLGISGQSLVASRGTVSVAGSPDVTASLTGLSISVARGSITGSSALALLGQAAGLSQGTTATTLSLAITGQSLTTSLGAISVPAVVPPTPPYVPPTIFYGFHNHRPTTVSWGPDSSSGAVWRRNNKDPSKWS